MVTWVCSNVLLLIIKWSRIIYSVKWLILQCFFYGMKSSPLPLFIPLLEQSSSISHNIHAKKWLKWWTFCTIVVINVVWGRWWWWWWGVGGWCVEISSYETCTHIPTSTTYDFLSEVEFLITWNDYAKYKMQMESIFFIAWNSNPCNTWLVRLVSEVK